VASRSVPGNTSEREIEVCINPVLLINALWYSFKSNIGRLQQNIHQEMKANFPHEQCFKTLCPEQGAESEGSNYCRLHQSLLGQICTLRQKDFLNVASILEQNVKDLRRN
jgi:hypothetical protein